MSGSQWVFSPKFPQEAIEQDYLDVQKLAERPRIFLSNSPKKLVASACDDLMQAYTHWMTLAG
jgi:hypothetical protein